MEPTNHFRTAFNGFNREDVVNYIEYLNNQHKAQLEQLNNQLLAAQSAQQPVADTSQMEERLAAALEKCAELEEMLADRNEQPAPVPAPTPEPVPAPAPVTADTTQELEAYRRAERAERKARERAQQIYEKATAALADATRQAEEAAAHIGAIADQAAAHLQECQDSVAATKSSFEGAVAALYAIKPEDDED